MNLLNLGSTLVSIAIGVMLLTSGLAKQRHLVRWWQALDHYRLLPKPLKRTVSRLIPWAEIVIGIGLCLPWIAQWAAGGATLLFLTFAVAIAGNWAQGVTRFDCGCSFAARTQSPHAAWLLSRALLLTALSLWLTLAAAVDSISLMLMLPIAVTGALITASWQQIRQRPSVR